MIPIIFNIIVSLIFTTYEKTESDITFSHKAHFGDRDIECQACHKAAQSVSADDINMPGHDECSECHSVSNAPDDCGICHADPANPKGITMAEREITFSHRAHLGDNPTSDDCLSCHQGIDQLVSQLTSTEYPWVECEACHSRPAIVTALVHPPDWGHAHKFAAADDQRQSCAPCHHNESFCTPAITWLKPCTT